MPSGRIVIYLLCVRQLLLLLWRYQILLLLRQLVVRLPRVLNQILLAKDVLCRHIADGLNLFLHLIGCQLVVVLYGILKLLPALLRQHIFLRPRQLVIRVLRVLDQLPGFLVCRYRAWDFVYLILYLICFGPVLPSGRLVIQLLCIRQLLLLLPHYQILLLFGQLVVCVPRIFNQILLAKDIVGRHLADGLDFLPYGLYLLVFAFHCLSVGILSGLKRLKRLRD